MRPLLALLLLAAWIAVTVLTGRPVAESTTIAAVVTGGLARQLAFASALLVAAALILRWPDLGFARPRPGTWRLLWLPGLYVAAFLAAGVAAGLPPAGVLLILAANALLGSFSEETMFRGFLYAGLRDALPVWPAILLTSLLFGAPHVLNFALVGHLGTAVGQAVFAGLSGIMFLSLRIRTGSLWPVILLHAAWNAGLILIGREAAPLAPDEPLPALAVLLTAAAMLPLLAYPIWLLRDVGRTGDGVGRRSGAGHGTKARPARSPLDRAAEGRVMTNGSGIREGMEVIGADGAPLGHVDRVDGDRIKLTRRDSGQGHHRGHHHFLPLALVAEVEGDRVRLSATGAVAAGLFEEEEGGEATA